MPPQTPLRPPQTPLRTPVEPPVGGVLAEPPVGGILGAPTPPPRVGPSPATPIPSAFFTAGLPPSVQVGVGALKSALQTVAGGGQLLRSAVPILDRTPSVTLPINLEAETPLEAAGKAAGTVAQFVVPGLTATKAATAFQTGAGLASTLSRIVTHMGAQGATAAAVDAVQRGTTDGALTTGAVAAATEGAAPLVAKGLGALGERIGAALIRPSTRDVQDGFKVVNIYKHDLAGPLGQGTLGQVLEHSTTKLKTLGDELRTALQTPTGQPAPTIDLMALFKEAEAELTRGSARTVGQNAAITRAMQTIREDPFVVQYVQPSGLMDLAVAQDMKRAMSDLGSWAYGMRDAESNAIEQASNVLYTKLRHAIEAAAPVGPTKIAAINRAMSEILPVRQAALRRLPVEQRKAVLNMADLIGIGTDTLGLSIANRVLQSGRTANALVKTGAAMPGPGAIAPVAAAGVSALQERKR